jgi:type II secretory pathway component PulF
MLERIRRRGGGQTTVLAPGAKLFNYTAVTTAGVRHRGKMQGASQAAVSESLQNDGWIPLTIEEIKLGGVNTDVGSLLTAKPVTLTSRQTSTFARQLAELLKAGVPLPRAIEALASEGSANIQKISATLVELVSSGVPLSQALKTFPKAFDEIFCSYVEAGESAGTLAVTMARLAKTLERRSETQMKIKAVTAYPKMVSSAIGGIVVGILIYMVPMYAEIYANFGQELPATTVALQTITAKMPPFTFTSNMPFPAIIEGLASPLDMVYGLVFSVLFVGGTWLRNRTKGKASGKIKTYAKYAAAGYLLLFAYDYQLNIIATIVWSLLYVGYVAFMTALDSGKLEDVWALRVDKMRFRMPIFGPLLYQSTLHRWTSVLAGALEAGVPLDNAIDLAARTSGSRSHIVASRMIRAQLRNGLPLSESLNSQKELYPPSIRTMVSTGEQAGELHTMVENIAHSIDGEIDTIIAGLAAKIEVALLVGMGVIVGGLLVVLYLPILQLSVSAGEGMGAF